MKELVIFALVPVFAAQAAFCAVKPTRSQLEWADCEIGVIIPHATSAADGSETRTPHRRTTAGAAGLRRRTTPIRNISRR